MSSERDQLKRIIQQWNENRLDLFALSEPNEELEFHGVMRFYFIEAGQKAATKCVRVSSTATTRAVIDALVEKFHPDMRMLTTPKYSLSEVHENGEERTLAMDEKPLLVQLNWHKDDREGRFLLRRDGEKLPLQQIQNDPIEVPKQMSRKLSKREKKELKKQEKMRAVREAEDAVAEKLYQEVPQNSFTRTISNPEIVMKKRRERKLEQKLREMGETPGNTGGSLKVYGESLSSSKPYVTLLVSVKDPAYKLVKDTLEKYALDKEDPINYCLVEVLMPPIDDNQNSEGMSPTRERILDDDECPLLILTQSPPAEGQLMFHVRKRLSHMARGRRVSRVPPGVALSPCLAELNADGSDVAGDARIYRLQPNVTEVGSDRSMSVSRQSIPLFGPYVHPKHCVVAFMDGVVTITPCSPNAEIQINNQPISETTILRDGCTVRIGRSHLFRFLESAGEGRPLRQRTLSEPNVHAPKNQANLMKSASAIRVHSAHRTLPSVSSSSLQRMLAVPIGPQLSSDSADKPRSRPKSVNSILETTFDTSGHVETVGHAEFVDSPTPVSDKRPDVYMEAVRTPSGIATHPTAFDFLALTRPLKTPTIVKSESITPTAAITVKQSNGQMEPLRRPQFAGRDAIPAIIELFDDAEDQFLTTIIRDLDPSRLPFQLSPVYVLYMTVRYRLSPHYRTGMPPAERNMRINAFLSRVTDMLHVTIQDHCHDAGALALWMANSSELLNLFRCDRDLAGVTSPEPQESLADAVQKAFGHLAACLRQELHQTLPAMLDQSLDDASASNPCLQMLSGSMSLLRQCKVNAALTIQLFSQLFHHINMALFNWLLAPEGISYCCRSWGLTLQKRLSTVLRWAEAQGLEMAAECHMGRVTHAAQLLIAPKRSIDDLSDLCSVCQKLNSHQIQELMQRYQLDNTEPPLDQVLIENLLKVAESTTDESVKSEGRPIAVQEDAELHLPFLLPEDGYTPDMQRGLPNSLKDFMGNLMRTGLCRMILQPSSSGSWKVHFTSEERMATPTTPQSMNEALMPSSSLTALNQSYQPQPAHFAAPPPQQFSQKPEVMAVTLNRGNGGIGLSIVAAQAADNSRSGELGIYIKKIVEGSLAERDGRLQPGDQIYSVNDQSLMGLSQEKAAEIMARSGPEVRFVIGKKAALYNGLATLLNQPSPPPNEKAYAMPPQQQLRLRGEGQLIQSAPQNGYGQFAPKQPSPPSYGQNGRPQSQTSMQQPVVQHLHYENGPERVMSPVVPYTPPSYSGAQHDPTDIRYAQQHQPAQQQHIRSMSTSNVSRQNPTQMPPRRPYEQMRVAETLPKDFNPQLAQTYYGSQQRGRNGSVELSAGEPEYQNFSPTTGSRPQSGGYGDRPVQQIPTRTVPYATPPAGGRIAIPPTTQELNSYNVGSIRHQPSQQQYATQESHEGRRTPNGYPAYNSAADQLQRGSGGPVRSAGSVGQIPSSPSMANPTYQSPMAQQQRYRPPMSHANAHYAGPPPARSAVYRAPAVSNPHLNVGPPNGSGLDASQSQIRYGRPLSATENYKNQTTPTYSPPTEPSQPAFFPSPPSDLKLNGAGHNYQNVRLPLLADPPVRPLPSHKSNRPYANVEVGKFSSSTSSIPSAMHSKTQSHLMSSSSSSQVSASQVPYMPQQQRTQPDKYSSPSRDNLGSSTSNLGLHSSQQDISPWEKEERRRQQENYKKEVEAMMDNEIADLEAKEDRSQQEEQRLTALRLEREFQRRLKEAHDDDPEMQNGEDDDESPNSPIPPLPIADITRVVQEDLERKRQDAARRMETERLQAQEAQQRQQEQMRRQQEEAAAAREAQLEQERLNQKYRMMQEQMRKQKEMERLEQERIQREMAHRQRVLDEERQRQQQLQLEEVNYQLQQNSIHDQQPDRDVRKVQFQDELVYPVPYKATGNRMETYTNGGVAAVDQSRPQVQPKYEVEQTAKVIGAQEVYRDPRENRLKQIPPKNVQDENEKLSFRDKMRLIAAQAGEQTPKDKLKISSAQREIETTILSPQQQQQQ